MEKLELSFKIKGGKMEIQWKYASLRSSKYEILNSKPISIYFAKGVLLLYFEKPISPQAYFLSLCFNFISI
jgi:hypothetical protein